MTSQFDIKIKNKSNLITEAIALVAQPKQFKLDSDKVSATTKKNHLELYTKHCEKFSHLTSEYSAALNKSEYEKLLSTAMLIPNEQNTVWMHELYFANCFCRNSQISISSLAYARLARDFGSFDDWQRDFISRHKQMNGAGWIVTAYNFFLQKYVTMSISKNDCNMLLGSYPVIVIDCWEHSYICDYQTNVMKYLEAMMCELNWDIIGERFLKVEAMSESIK